MIYMHVYVLLYMRAISFPIFFPFDNFLQDSEGYDIEIVICAEGIKVYRDNKRLNVFAWYDYKYYQI